MVSTRQTFEQISRKIFVTLLKTFPVACASDEFYFFPHIADPSINSVTWDDFSTGSIKGIIREISESIRELDQLTIPDVDEDGLADKNMLALFLNNLHDQLSELELWKKQPSFYLTLLNSGLVQAANQEDKKLLTQRLKGIPDFLGQATQNLEEVPYWWREISLSMTDDCKHFLDLVSTDKRDNELSFKAIKAFEDKIKSIPANTELNISSELLGKIYRNNLATGLTLPEILRIIDDEILEMLQVMLDEGGQILNKSFKSSLEPDILIKNVYDKIGLSSGKQSDPVELFQNELNRIKAHLTDICILEGNSDSFIPVIVEEMPQHFTAIRSASSYSIYPKNPPVNGNFYVLTSSGYGVPSENLDEYKMLTAHETYPGHHLLDSSRLILKNIVRRSLEFPLFYEGWASFAEVLLSYSGYFKEPADRFILAKRRYWRAVRGQVDIGLQTKKLDFESAANILQRSGISYKRAIASVKIYTLNPGYQTCYTVGIRRFLDLFDRYGKNDMRKFVRTVLGNGEILFPDLENLMKNPHS